MSEEDLASKISTETPWWAKAPVWLAAGIVGVPSLIAISAGYFIANNVTHRINILDQYSLSELHMLNLQQNRWEAIKSFMQLEIRIDMANFLNTAKVEQDRQRCLRTMDLVKIPDPP